MHLLDFPVAQLNAYGKPFMSETMSVEYDCIKKRSRGLTLVQYSKNMGEGEKIASFEGGDTWVNFSESGVSYSSENQLLCRPNY